MRKQLYDSAAAEILDHPLVEDVVGGVRNALAIVCLEAASLPGDVEAVAEFLVDRS